MKYSPILFSTPMVQAIMAGRKTMTRRIVDKGSVGTMWFECETNDAKLAPHHPGEILWVRETWQEFFPEEVTEKHQQGPRGFAGIPAEDAKGHHMHFYYRADGEVPDHPTLGKALWKPSIFMPKEACRLFLRVTDVRAERLQEISFDDAIAEGTFQAFGYVDEHGIRSEGINLFQKLWDSINAKRGYGWDKNPWVWVYSFERIDKPEGWPL